MNTRKRKNMYDMKSPLTCIEGFGTILILGPMKGGGSVASIKVKYFTVTGVNLKNTVSCVDLVSLCVGCRAVFALNVGCQNTPFMGPKTEDTYDHIPFGVGHITHWLSCCLAPTIKSLMLLLCQKSIHHKL